MRSLKVLAAISVIVLLPAGLSACNPSPQADPTTAQTTAGSPQSSTTAGGSAAVTRDSSPTSTTAGAAELTAMLQYLIEEEKLAHDVYQQFARMWDVRIFENIRDSEVQHQQELLLVLNAKGIADPRTGVPGTFKDQRVQQMYNQFIQQGSSSLIEAYQAGTAIEEQDIADLNEHLKSTTDPMVVPALQRLLAGSENHLQAFQARLD
ncbi:hypothetical protein J2X12_003952 [Pseudarthrobacter oxydans]|jgi:hypothetical protein|uniref:DUF2202 domain-containing protein n=1 Tax=Pseudarthrobacter oxydans TaxID=1671 RepID=A0AAW8NE82_PSEOX|nr:MULTISPECIES: DUF2202 domain-containing protein [Micrococcaceae]MDR7165898.1 hypothetical protein [Pseudarthrobacter oxydans]TNB67645.1 DUF2202 domain-containing protein [Arthrobacter sp. BB-1]